MSPSPHSLSRIETGERKDEAAKPVADLRAIDCKTPEDWARWARERVEYENGYGHERGRRW